MSEQKIKDHCRKISQEVLALSGPVERLLEPLQDGINFASDAYFVEMRNGGEKINLFVKVPPQSNNFRQLLFESLPDDLYMFEREFYVYNSLRHLFETFIKNQKQDPKEILDFFPVPITPPGEMTFSRGIEQPLVFENLSMLGYAMWENDWNGFDFEHANIAIKMYGKMHALGLVLHESDIIKDENLLKLLNIDMTKSFFNEAGQQTTDAGLKAFIIWMKDHHENEESISKLEDQLRNRNYMRMLSEMFNEGKNHELQVVLHGDATSNNMLFKYDTQNKIPVRSKLVDFQMSSFFTPFFDLAYFFLLSVSADVVIRNFNTLISSYQMSMEGTLKCLNYPKPVPGVEYISDNVHHYAPMVLPHTCLTVNVKTGEGNPDLWPGLRERKFRTTLEKLKFFGVL